MSEIVTPVAKLAMYCHIYEPTEEDEVMLTLLYTGAVADMAAAGVEMPEEDGALRPMFDLCVFALVQDGFDRRSAQTDGKVLENPAWRRRVNRLKLG